MKINRDQFWGAVQHLFTALIAYIVGKGWLPADLAGHVLTIVLFGLALAVQHYWNSLPGAVPSAGDPPSKGAPPSALALLLVAGFLCASLAAPLSGCKTLKEEVAKPAVQAGIRQAALLALNAGLSALADSVKETRPYVALIQQRLGGAFSLSAAVPFSPPATTPAPDLAPPDLAAANLRALVAHSGAPPDIQAQITAAMRESLTPPPAAGPPDEAADAAAAYRAAVAAAL